MEEVFIKNNTELRIFINGKPNLANMPTAELDLLACGIELQMTEHFKFNNHTQESLADELGFTVDYIYRLNKQLMKFLQKQLGETYAVS